MASLTLVGLLGRPRAARPLAFATTGRVDGLMFHENRPEDGTSMSVLSVSSKRIGLPSTPAASMIGEVLVLKVFFSRSTAPGGALPVMREWRETAAVLSSALK